MFREKLKNYLRTNHSKMSLNEVKFYMALYHYKNVWYNEHRKDAPYKVISTKKFNCR